MATLTPVLGLQKPIVGADDDIWGNMWNQNADILDGLVKPVDLNAYLKLTGGTMLGAIYLAGNAILPMMPVPLQQMQTSLATKPNEAPNDGAYYARRNQGWEPSPGSAINQDAPSDGFAYGRRNASWDKTLRLAGGVVTGPTTIMGAEFTAKGNLFLGNPEPPNIAASSLEYGGGILSLWHVMADGIANDMYYDTGAAAFRRTSATNRPTWYSQGDGAFYFQNSPVGALDSVAPLTTVFTIDLAGSTTAVGNVWATNRPGALGLADFSTGYYGLRFTTDGWRLQFSPATGVIQYIHPTSGQLWAVDAAGTMTANGYLYGASNGRVDGSWTAGAQIVSYNGRLVAQRADNPSLTMYCLNSGYAFGLYVDGTTLNFCQSYGDGAPLKYLANINTDGSFSTGGAVTAGYIHNTGSTQTDGDSNTNGYVRSYLGRVISQAGAANPGFCCHWPGVFANGIICDGNGNLLFGQMDGNGGWVNTWGRFDTSSNFWSNAAVTGTYLHSTGDVRADSWVYAGGRVVSGEGVFQIAEGYCLKRQSWDGMWVFFEGGTWNLQIQTNGDVRNRGTHYVEGHLFSYNGVYVGNDWGFGLYKSGNDRLLQHAGNWYWRWQAGDGTLVWNLNGGNFWILRSDALAYNAIARTGGIGPYADFSDARLKDDVRPAEYSVADILKLEPKRYRRKQRHKDIPVLHDEVGFIAQDVQKAIPDAVTMSELDGEPTLVLASSVITAALVGAMKEVNARLIKLEGRHK